MIEEKLKDSFEIDFDTEDVQFTIEQKLWIIQRMGMVLQTMREVLDIFKWSYSNEVNLEISTKTKDKDN